MPKIFSFRQICPAPPFYLGSMSFGANGEYQCGTTILIFQNLLKPDIWEFHLSYSDMDLSIDKYISSVQEAGFVVHAPELFANSHLLDLTSADDNYRSTSIKEMQRVIDITRDLKRLFPMEKRPMIVTNIGGFSMDAPIDNNSKVARYETFLQSLDELDTDGVEIIPQTMAPFPWHFGGQRYQNLFLRVEETADFCERHSMRLCFDVSHTYLTCNELDFDFYKALEILGPYTAHLHIGDALGTNGEGLQIGHGEIDFARLGNILDDKCPDASFIPEIWQGHKNQGDGFREALDKLSELW